MHSTQQSRNVYDLFASVYASHFGFENVRHALPVYERLLLSSLPAGAPLLDLCCGAGHLAAALIDSGFRVTGLDSSAAMLTEARANAPGAEFIHADACDFDFDGDLRGRFFAVLSTFNSLAHFEDADVLARVFTNVHTALSVGAGFAFDVFMQDAYQSRWQGSFHVDAGAETCEVQPSYDPQYRMARNRIVLRDNTTGEIVSEFTLLQKCHSEDEIRSALMRAGFTDALVFDGARDFKLPDEDGHAFFLCR